MIDRPTKSVPRGWWSVTIAVALVFVVGTAYDVFSDFAKFFLWFQVLLVGAVALAVLATCWPPVMIKWQYRIMDRRRKSA